LRPDRVPPTEMGVGTHIRRNTARATMTQVSADATQTPLVPALADDPRAQRPRLRGRARRSPGYRRLSLYTRVVLMNSAVLLTAAALLALSPATVSFPLGLQEAIVLGLGLAVIVFANVYLLRISFRPLARLVELMQTIDLLRPGQRLEISGGIEVRQVISTFNKMLDGLERERQESNRRTITAQEAASRRIGNELHDEIGQRLTGVLLQLQRSLEPGQPEISRTHVLEAQELVRSTLDEIGRIAWQLRPGILDDLGLRKALAALTEDLGERTSASIDLHIAETISSLGSECDLAIYRIAQESLTNALRHGHPRRVELELTTHNNGGVRLRVRDDGQGLPASHPEGAGLRGMRERALLVGAELTINSEPGDGVCILLDVPRPQEAV
jgi:two-component system, NarL family, sensor histidine kinase UhpB